MKQLQKKRFDEFMKRANPKLKLWQKQQKQLAEPAIGLGLSLRKQVGKEAFEKGFKKEDKWLCAIIEYIATGKPALKDIKKEQPSTEVFVAKPPAKEKASVKKPAKKIAKKKTSK